MCVLISAILLVNGRDVAIKKKTESRTYLFRFKRNVKMLFVIIAMGGVDCLVPAPLYET